MLQIAHLLPHKVGVTVAEHIEMLWRNANTAALIDEMAFDPTITSVRLFGHDSLRTLMWRHNRQDLILAAKIAGDDFKGAAIAGGHFSLVDLLVSKSHTGGDALGHGATEPFRQAALQLLKEGVSPMLGSVYLGALMADAENQTLSGPRSLWHALLSHFPPSEDALVKTGFKLLLDTKLSGHPEVIKALVTEGGLTPDVESRHHSALMPGGLLGVAISRKRYAATALLLKEGFSLIGDASTPEVLAKINLWPADRIEEMRSVVPSGQEKKTSFRIRF